ncbi:lysozyme inhibitor LprI family protein [Ahrensia kielensis]|uniref:lysozyme inhibitor LprI family protein n=1 Tax=Ahrensia kielensis TaxID=76980 RepID=UPI0003642D63|nr:lysozyme inhibitor LprI family protein [Ahrensia kielensis]
MIRTILTAALLALMNTITPALSQDVDCDNAETQFDMNHCSGLEFKEADNALNEAWSTVRAAVKSIDESNKEFAPDEPSAADNLLKAQRAWIDYRDGQCAAEAAQYAGGSIQPLIRNTCLAGMTKKRTGELQQMIVDR